MRSSNGVPNFDEEDQSDLRDRTVVEAQQGCNQDWVKKFRGSQDDAWLGYVGNHSWNRL